MPPSARRAGEGWGKGATPCPATAAAFRHGRALPQLSASRLTRALVWLAASCAFAAPYPASAQQIPHAEQTRKESQAPAATHLSLRFNHELLAQLGLQLRDTSVTESTAIATAAPHRVDLAFVPQTVASVTWRGASPQAWQSGEWRSTHGFVLADTKGQALFDYRDFRLRARPGSTELDFVGADGSAGFYADSVMAIAARDRRSLDLLSLDLRLSAAAARRLGKPGWSGLTIGDASGSLAATIRGEAAASSCAVPHWPGSDGGAYVADIQLDAIDVQMMRCGEPGCEGNACTCDGPGGSDPAVVFAPNAELSNTSDDNGGQPCTPQDPCSADVPWNAKFSEPRPPYGNDQHAMLVWNLYRLDADGGISQIGRSGAKHAFIALNLNCDCTDAHILGRGCGDQYSTNNNDNQNALGPRGEIAPASVRWGRCGALQDDEVVPPNPDYGGCDGVRDPSGGSAWSDRLTVRESQIDPALHPHSRFLFEAWYLVREDIDIYNSMGYIEVQPQWNGAWEVPRVTGSEFRRGPALTLWADAPGAQQQVVDTAADSRGQLRLATRVAALPNGRWRYDYALMNFDFAESELQGVEPNPRLLANDAVSAAGLAIPSDARVFAQEADDGDSDGANDWTFAQDGHNLRWQAVSGDLGWGRLLRFAIVADGSPVSGTLRTWLGGGASRSGPALATLVPGTRDSDRLFADAFQPLLRARTAAAKTAATPPPRGTSGR